MIVGIGIDIVEIHRIKKAIESSRFVDKIYTLDEQEYLKVRKQNVNTAAGYFAAKEAMAKALGTGIGQVKWVEIEITRIGNGKPNIKLHGQAKTIMDDMGGRNILLSISHSREYAVAQVIIC
ncbi:MAG TPA: holo-ACP synthase [Clostridia bacterium]|nr:holo-ACP synthase [Clostridia bacterium]